MLSLTRALALGIVLCAWTSASVGAQPAAPASDGGMSTNAATGALWVSGYYAGWYYTWYPPSAVDMSTMTHFIFARYAPGGGTLGGSAGQLVQGAGTAHSANVEDALVAKAHASGV